MSELPLFPLHTVLFPGGLLSLRIFETRYVDLIGRCLREDGSFGVCLIHEGSEAGAPPTFADTGTSARIVDWSQRPDGLLGITAFGDRRFRVLCSRVHRDNLVVADIEWLAEPPAARPGAEHAWLAGLLAAGGASTAAPDVDLDAAALGFRLAELLPLPPATRQELLEIDAPSARLDKIGRMLQPGSAGARTG